MLRDMLHTERTRFMILLFLGVGIWALAIAGLLLFLLGLSTAPVGPVD